MEKAHTIHIRGLDDETYWKLRELKKRYRVRDWATLLKKMAEDIEEAIKEAEWI
jgi:hypothetical protein